MKLEIAEEVDMRLGKRFSKISGERLIGLKGNDRNAVFEFKEKLRRKFGDRIYLIKLFGSKARSQAEPFSDIDLFVVLDRANEGSFHTINGMAVEINLKYDVVLSPIVHSLAEYRDPRRRVTPFFRNVMQEGLAV